MSSCRVGSSAIVLTFSLSLFFSSLPRSSRNEESLIPRSFSLPTFSPPLERRDRAVLYVLLIIRILSLSLVNMVKWSCKLDRCVTYVRYNFKDIDS